MRYDLYSESNVGVIFTDREFLDSYSRVGGFDSQFRIGRNQRLGIRAVGILAPGRAGVDRTGHMLDIGFRKEGRNLSYGLMHFSISPDFRTDTGFVRRVDQRQTVSTSNYRWWPESWVINWGPRSDYSRNYIYDGTLQDEQSPVGVNVQFAQEHLRQREHRPRHGAVRRDRLSKDPLQPRRRGQHEPEDLVRRLHEHRQRDLLPDAIRSSAAARTTASSQRCGRSRGSSPKSA